MKTLTIIIPSYNTSIYVDECIPTFISEDCKNQLEILIIDDGSKDDTLAKAQRYEESNPECVRVISKENGGHGSVINRGVQEASGRYFKVVDGDDWIITDNLKPFLNFLDCTDADMILNPFIQHNVKNGEESIISHISEPLEVTQDFDVAARNLKVGIHSVTYKVEIFRQHNIQMAENCFYEDQQYDVFPIPYIQTVTFYGEPLYVYRVGTETQSINVGVNIKNREMSDRIIDSLLEFVDSLPEDISYTKREFIYDDIAERVNGRASFYLKLPFGVQAKSDLGDFFEHVKSVSPVVYSRSTSLPIRLLRKDSWLFYTTIYTLFAIRRHRRGF